MRRLNLTSVFVILLIFSISFGAKAKLQVVTTFSILTDFVVAVGGDRVDVSSIVPLGGDPHNWEATPREARIIATADVLFYNGLGLELWIDRLIENAADPELPIVVLTKDLVPLPSPSHDHVHIDDYHHHHENGDPHFWLDVQYSMDYVKTITDTLIEFDPENAAYFQARSIDYLDQLAELDQWLMDVIAEIPTENRKLLTYHNSLAYLAERYGLTVEAFLVVNPDREPSPQEMIELTRLLAKHPRKAIFTEPQTSSAARYVSTIASEVGGNVYTLHSESLTNQLSTYIEMMRHNGATLLEALQ